MMGFPQTKAELTQAIDAQRKFLSGTESATDDETLRERGYALWKIGEQLLRLHRIEPSPRDAELEDAVTMLDDAAATLWPFSSERHTAVYARWRQAITLDALGRADEGVEVLNTLVAEIGLDWNEPNYPDLMPVILGALIGLQRDCGHMDAAESVADAAIERFSDGTTPAERTLLGISHRAKASAAEVRGDTDAALALLNEVVTRCSDVEGAPYPDELLSQVAQALVRSAVLLEMVGRRKEAVAAYDEVIARCAAMTGVNPNIDWAVATARGGKKRLKPRRLSREGVFRKKGA